MKLNDLYNNWLEKIIDIKNIYVPKNINVFPIKKSKIKIKWFHNNTSQDLQNWLQDINFKSKNTIKIYKNVTKVFDSVNKCKKNKDIDLKEEFINNPNLKNVVFIEKQWFKIRRLKEFELKNSYLNFINYVSYKFNKNYKNKFVIIIFTLIIIFLLNTYFVVKMINLWYTKLLTIKNNSWNIELIKKNVNDSKFDFLVWWFFFKPFLLFNLDVVNNGYNIIEWWKELADLWDNSIKTYFKIKDLINKKWADNIMLSNIFFNLREDLINLNISLEVAYNYYDKIKNLWNKDLEEKLKLGKKSLQMAIYYTKIINDNFDNILHILWHYDDKKYLVIFQNSDEIRPTGWFMWSMWILTLWKWKVLDFEKKDVYAHEWELKKTDLKKEKAPKWLDQITNTFWLRDSNYFINISESSNSIKWFMEKAWYKIDWIIYLNQNTILDFLAKNWKVDSSKIGEIISDKNFSEIMSTLVEAKIFKEWVEWTPKQILFDFITEFTSELKKKWDYYSYLKIILSNISKKNIIIYSFDEKENSLFKQLWLNWNINYSSTFDFNYPVFTSISWNKSDRYMERSFEKKLKINKDCSIETSLNIKSKHNLTKDKENELNILMDNYNIQDKENALNIQWTGDNNQFVRLVIPKKAIIKANKNINIVEWDKTKVLEFFIKTKKLETTNFFIEYNLPNKNCKNYDYTFYKQPWLKNYNFTLEKDNIKLERNWIDLDFVYKN